MSLEIWILKPDSWEMSVFTAAVEGLANFRTFAAGFPKTLAFRLRGAAFLLFCGDFTECLSAS